jgi:hypothetical protein
MPEPSSSETKPPAGIEEFRAQVILDAHDHIDKRLSRSLKSVALWLSLLIGLVAFVIGVLGYAKIEDFLSHHLQQQVDEFFAEKGASRLREAMSEAEKNLADAKALVSTLREKQERLAELDALQRLLNAEKRLRILEMRDDYSTRGWVSIEKGSEFTIVYGTRWVTFKVLSIELNDDEAVIRVQASPPALSIQRELVLRASHVLDDKRRKTLVPKVTTYQQLTEACEVRLVIASISSESSAVIGYHVRACTEGLFPRFQEHLLDAAPKK